jgi:hypothetical protein
MESAVTKGDRIDAHTVGDRDELARARAEEKYPHEFAVPGNIGLSLSQGAFVVEELSGTEPELWTHMKKAKTPGIVDPCLLVRTRSVHLPLERGELAGFKGRLQMGFNILMFSEVYENCSWFWIRDSVRADPRDAKGFMR